MPYRLPHCHLDGLPLTTPHKCDICGAHQWLLFMLIHLLNLEWIRLIVIPIRLRINQSIVEPVIALPHPVIHKTGSQMVKPLGCPAVVHPTTGQSPESYQ
jgi:hypothetical protein